MMILAQPPTDKVALARGLVDLQASTGLKLSFATDNGEPPCVVHQRETESLAQQRSVPPARATRFLFDLPATLPAAPPQSMLTPEQQRADGCNPRSKQVLEFVKTFNQNKSAIHGPFSGARLSVDLVTSPYQLLDDTGTDKHGVKDFSSQAATYWQLMDLFRAWQFTQIAAPTPRRIVRVAVVDRDFFKDDPDITWDQHDDMDKDDHVFGTQGAQDVSWHGSNCASALNATVRGDVGASGAALLGTQSFVPALTPTLPRVQTIAAEQAFNTAQSTIQFMECAIWHGGADVVSVSRGVTCINKDDPECTDQDHQLELLLQYAASNSVSAFFAAGQDWKELNSDRSGSPYQWGCQTRGALCVGGVGAGGHLAQFNGTYSNYGSAVTLWGPAEQVPVSADPKNTGTQGPSGTSIATPFIAGAVALSEAVWGKTFSNEELRQPLQNAGVPGKDEVVTSVPQIFPLMKTRPDGVAVVVLRDKREAAGNDTLAFAKAHPAPPPTATELLSLHDANDIDFLPIVQAVTGTRKIQIKYLATGAIHGRPDPHDVVTLQPTLLNALNVPISGTDLGAGNQDSYPNSGVATLVFNDLPAGAYFLRILSPNKLVTAYTVDPNYATTSGDGK